MSAAAFRWAMECGRRLALSVGERMLLVVLASRTGSEGSCCPGQHTLIEDTGLAERGVRLLTGQLASRGLIRVSRHGRVLHYHIMRANGMDPEPKQHRQSVPVSEPETPAVSAGIDPPTPAPDAGIPGRYRHPVPVFDAQTAPTTRARVDSPNLEKKEEDSESPVSGKGEEVQEEREGDAPDPTPKTPQRAFQLPDIWSPNDYSFSLGHELGLTDDEIRFEADAMRDWALDKRQTGTQWDRRFNNWLRNEAKRRRRHGIRHRPQRTLEEEWGLGSLLTPVFDDDDLPPSERPGAPRLQ